MSPVIGSKVFTIPWTNTIMGGGLRTSPDSLVTALQGSVGRVGGPLDLWSIHFPFPVRVLCRMTGLVPRRTDGAHVIDCRLFAST